VTAARDRAAVAGGSAALWVLAIVDAGLLIASGAIHLHLWDIAYQHVPTLGPLFLVQAISALVLALTILVTRHLLAVAAGLALVAGTIIGFILVRTVGLFGFHLTFSSGLANAVLVVEAAAVVALAATGLLLIRRGALATLPGWLRPGQS
jgi:hypothetical protein